MENKNYFHVYADGDDGIQLIVCEKDFRVMFNLVGVTAAKFNGKITILAFSIEDTHLHFLLHGTRSDCESFTDSLMVSYHHYLANDRGNCDWTHLEFVPKEIEDESYLRLVSCYIIYQPTKDHKDIMPYDYKWGTASMYFRHEPHIPIWAVNSDGSVSQPVQIGSMTKRQKAQILHSRTRVPDNWLVVNGILLPDNYVNVVAYEKIYGTANSFRVFMGSSRKAQEEIRQTMAESRGLFLEDLELRKIVASLSKARFNTSDLRRVEPIKRYGLSDELYRRYHISIRQLAKVLFLPEPKLRDYLK